MDLSDKQKHEEESVKALKSKAFTVHISAQQRWQKTHILYFSKSTNTTKKDPGKSKSTGSAFLLM